ncbi:hypothetical protein [Priestia megaterium]|uniref:hypothetical protein n=1 Tax=Priestia megaterium TaxID=1404 RepID=UPI000D5215CE|nr:hypothetical protein [Priestia megaterium]PVE74497.1 hypothetical protein DC428_00890 [Priestia megaterium]PVE82432.1 hypothetical protein DC421_20080 [Priestia megaterium]PVE87018.1 hypothetical protein DC426_17085 [Priestia megaterium]PVE94549.1 hypothetical protein DC433_24230 [Priestia megaterium]
MSYYYKKYLKGSSDDEYRRRCDNEWHKHHCNRRCDDDCERPDFDDRPAFGTVTGTTTVAGTGVPVTTPLTLNLLSPSENVRVVSGGLEVLERGEYFISFTAFSTPAASTVTYTINTGGFTQTITPTAGTATASFLRYLRRGDTVTVTATVTAAADTTTTINATLSVAKVSSRFPEKDFY